MQRINLTRRIYGCTVDRQALDELISLATIEKDSDTQTPDLTTKRGDVATSANSLDELLGQLGPSRPLKTISIWCSQYPRRISIDIDRDHAWVSVNGEDETWVRGRHTAIIKRLEERQHRGPVLSSGTSLAVASLLMAFLANLSAGLMDTRSSLLIAFGASVTIGLLVGYLGYRRSRCSIVLDEPPKSRRITFDKVNGLVATLLAAVIAYLTWVLVAKTK